MWIWKRRLASVLTATAGAALAFIAWYRAGGRDDDFEMAYVFSDRQTLMFAAGALCFWAVGLADHIRAHLRAAARRPLTTPQASAPERSSMGDGR